MYAKTEYLENIENMQSMHNKPFRIKATCIKDGMPDFTEEYHTGYSYWLTKIKGGGAQHMKGKFEDGVFKTRLRFAKDDWKEDDYNKPDYSYENEAYGRKAHYFEKKCIIDVEFLSGPTFEVYDKELRQKVKKPLTEAQVFFTNSMAKKILEALEDPRSSVTDYFVVQYTASNPPPTKYAIKYHSPGTTQKAAPVVTVISQFEVKPHERELLLEVNGEPASRESIIEFITSKAAKSGMEGLTPERVAKIAEAVLIGGVVTV